MELEGKTIEKEAHRLREEHKYQEAAELFQRMADSYKEYGKHHPAAMCLASAAGCWALKAGETTFYHAARDYEKAAKEAEKSGDWEYTALLYRHAAVCYDKDKESMEFADCYYWSKEFYRRHLWGSLIHLQKLKGFPKGELQDFLKRFRLWLTLTFSSLLWGHGERPQRTIFFGIFLILCAAVLYTRGYLLSAGRAIHPSITESIYFSVVTFLTIGYGDLVPVGFTKAVAILESFGGPFIMSIFITGLCRKYLRE